MQLAIVQDGTVRIDKQLDLEIPSGGGEKVHINGMGPIAADWPLRSRWLEGVDRRVLTGPLLDLPICGGAFLVEMQSPAIGRMAPARQPASPTRVTSTAARAPALDASRETSISEGTAQATRSQLVKPFDDRVSSYQGESGTPPAW